MKAYCYITQKANAFGGKYLPPRIVSSASRLRRHRVSPQVQQVFPESHIHYSWYQKN
jgi:hypothetical protein